MKARSKSQPAIDSLKRIQGFLEAKGASLNGEGSSLNTYNGKLGDLQSKLSYQQYIQGLIDQRSTSLKNSVGGLSDKVPALKGIEEQVFYAKARMKCFKQMADDPSIAEEKALEYLQGERGFDQALSRQPEGGLQAGMTVDDLEKAGFQTKRQLNESLQKQFGDNLGGIQEKMGSQVSDWQSKTQGISGKVNEASGQLAAAKTDLQ